MGSVGHCKKWFEDVIGGENPDDVDSLCRRINLRLVEFLCETGAERLKAGTKQAEAKIRFHEKVFRMVQTKTLDGLIEEAEAAVLPTRMAVVALVQVLHLMMEKRMKLALSKRHEEQKASVVGPVQRQPRKDVIQIFGWAVWSLRVALIKKANGKEERFVSVDSEEEEPEQKEIGFLTDMTMHAAETVLSDSYRKNWHNGFLSMHDRGYMMLIREEFCPFGLELMQKVAGLVTQDKLRMIEDVMRDAKDTILKDRNLLAKWLEACNERGSKHLDDMASRMKMFDKLVEKVANARFHEEIRIHREAHTARGSKDVSGLNFRQERLAENKKKGSKK